MVNPVSNFIDGRSSAVNPISIAAMPRCTSFSMELNHEAPGLITEAPRREARLFYSGLNDDLDRAIPVSASLLLSLSSQFQ
jgi:hypothetical protein